MLGHGASIVRNGLVLHLDAANPKSYPGSGTAWKDLSGNGNNGTLVNGVGYNSANNGSMVFDGIDDEAYLTVPQVNTTPGQYNTVEFMMYWTGGRNGFPMEFALYRLWQPTSPYVLGFNNGAGDCYGFDDQFLINKWTHLAAIFYNGGYTNNSKIYINGVNQPLSQKVGGATSGIASAQVTIAGYRLNSSYPFPGKIANFRIYNRALSAEEIQQNFNATRGRYGI